MEAMEKIRLILAASMKANRRRLRINQDQLAELSKLSLETIKKVETCDRWPSPETLEAIASGLNVTVAELLTEIPQTPKETPAPISFHSVLSAYQKIPEDIAMDLSDFTEDSPVWRLVRVAIRKTRGNHDASSGNHSAKG